MTNLLLQMISPIAIFLILALCGLGWAYAHNLLQELRVLESENEELKKRLGRI